MGSQRQVEERVTTQEDRRMEGCPDEGIKRLWRKSRGAGEGRRDGYTG